MGKSTVTFEIDEMVRDDLKHIAESLDRSTSSLIRMMIRNYIDRHLAGVDPLVDPE